MQKRDGQGETKAHTESGEEEAKGGENVQKINREDVVQAALMVERWCKANNPSVWPSEACEKCPFYMVDDGGELDCMVGFPMDWELEEKLRSRGLKHD